MLNVKKEFWILLLLCIFLLSSIILIRTNYSSNLLIGSDSYKSLILASDIKNNNIGFFDNLIYSGNVLFEEYGWYFLLSFNPEFLAKYLPLLFGLLCFVLFYFILSEINPKLRNLASIILIMSPSFLYLFSVANKYIVSLFFILLGIFLFIKDKKAFSFICFFLASLFSLFSIIFIILWFTYTGLRKQDYRYFFILFGLFLFSFIIQFFKLFQFGIPSLLFLKQFTLTTFLSSIILEFGSPHGLGFFMFVLGLIGIYHYFKTNYKYIFIYFLLIVVLLISFYIPYLLGYLSFIFAFFCAYALDYFLHLEWKMNIFKFLTLLILLCGFLFSFLVFYDNTTSFEPTPAYFEAINYLKKQPNQDVVFADYYNGNYLLYSNKKTFIDENTLYDKEIKSKLNDFDSLLNSKNISLTANTLNKYDVRYVLIDKKFKRDKFTNKEERFLFLIKYSPNVFAPIVINEEVELWQVKNIGSSV
ncbi:MAG TPA: hypothetical protein VJI68_03175 [Candidatus Nanoarchaeia archaeon]|nr:hypothetical protein [Candidatus Nanoarchaeia archaeon]